MVERRMSQDFRGEVQLKATFTRPLKATGVGRPQGKHTHTKHKPEGEAVLTHLGGGATGKTRNMAPTPVRNDGRAK